MRGFLLRTLISAAGLWIASRLLSGMRFENDLTLLGAAVLLGLVNATVRPLLVILTFPITILTLGLFLWVVNAAMLGLVAWLLDGFALDSFGTALVASLVLGFTSWLGSSFVGGRGQLEVMVVQARGGRRS